METVLLLLAVILKLVGVAFVFAAALGLIRFRDPFQRMHAATKAGTVGAIFTVLGVMCSMQGLGPTLIGLFVIAFLLLTVPVAGHLLGRAAYMSGGSIEGLVGEDALKGVLDRQDLPLEERIARGTLDDQVNVNSRSVER
ncbi:monovalent cation/H(+) antiporter subunit G [Aureimonas altamirensis]|uniref:monovalent cation/H(+) antiporter subunit G n=1 Tax=Aureimonas altamirensis TaxID=370622 RepID=UPI002036B4E9|nr:monovalent cation/H(+) antiporter subunit G [Aureimonas altamirensis]MCM2504334.1 monovalent cation/H(+) antiporter subunit G [Aureimonas altamirensis]